MDFQNMPWDSIHNINRNISELASIEKEIARFFASEVINGQDEALKDLYIEADRLKNPFAIEILAQFHLEGIILERSSEIHIEYLSKIIDICCEKYFMFADLMNKIKANEIEKIPKLNPSRNKDIVSLFGRVSKQLALYYSGSANKNDLNKSANYIICAKCCGENVDNIGNAIKNVISKNGEKNKWYLLGGVALGLAFPTLRLPMWGYEIYDIYNNRKNNKNIEKKINYQPEDDGYLEYSLNEVVANINIESFNKIKNSNDDLLGSCKKYVKEQFSSGAWVKMRKETKISLVTAVYTFLHNIGVEKSLYETLDHSAVVSLLMRALENELAVLFSEKYLQFLKQNYSIQEYASANNMKVGNLTRFRKAFFQNTADGVKYKEESSFRMGYMRFITGINARELSGMNFDTTIIEYLQSEVFYSQPIKKDIIEKWLENICDNLDMLRKQRNNAAHGGSIVDVADAKDVLDDILLVNKLLENILNPELHINDWVGNN